MKKILKWGVFLILCILNLFYLAMVADSFYQEYWLDSFVYWGYPQWGWMYADPKIYLWFNLFYLLFLLMCPAIGIWLWLRQRVKLAYSLLLLPMLSAGLFLYMPTYNWNRQFEIFEAERTTEDSRIPAGKWWVSVDQMQRYDDVSAWEKLKGYFGRGEWPGGYPIWGEYRIWLLHDYATDTLGRRGMVFHGGTKVGSPWGIDMGEDIVDFAIQIRRNKVPMEIEVRYGDSDERETTPEVGERLNEGTENSASD